MLPVADARGTTSYAYDSRNRPVQMSYPDGRVVAMAYDAHGQRTGLTATVGGQSPTTTTSYDAAGRRSAVEDPLGRSFTVTYDADGNRTGIAYPNATSTSYAYDGRRRLTGVTTTQALGSSVAPVTVQSLAYTLEPAGRRTQVTEADGTVRAYGYDGIDRLTSETVTGALQYAKAFTYDTVGNRLTQTTTGTGASTVKYASDVRDRLTTENATTYTYDPNGNLTNKSGEANYSWDFENRLTEVNVTGGGPVVTHQYDAHGVRVQTSVTPPSSGSGGPVACQSNAASFVREDTGTQGSWIGIYGGDGEYIDGLTAVPPPYGAVTFTGTSDFVVSIRTTDVRGLQEPPPQTSRAVTAYVTTGTETFHVSTTDGNLHTVALYLLTRTPTVSRRPSRRRRRRGRRSVARATVPSRPGSGRYIRCAAAWTSW